MYSHHYHYAAFDMDGTLLDSMQYWRHSIEEFLRAHGSNAEAVELQEKLSAMPIASGIAFVQDVCREAGIRAMTWEDDMAIMKAHYAHDIRPKPGVAAFLQELKRSGVPMCVATATPRELAEFALRVAGLDSYFDFVLGPEDYPLGKGDRAVFDGILTRFGSTAADTAIFEDALYSLRTAKSVGFYCVGIADPTAEAHRDEIRQLADEYYETYAG